MLGNKPDDEDANDIAIWAYAESAIMQFESRNIEKACDHSQSTFDIMTFTKENNILRPFTQERILDKIEPVIDHESCNIKTPKILKGK
jgi:hypothetical protein